MTNKLQIWCLERVDVPRKPTGDPLDIPHPPLSAYWATDHWIYGTTKGCTLMTERAAKVLLADYKRDRTDKRTYEVRRV